MGVITQGILYGIEHITEIKSVNAIPMVDEEGLEKLRRAISDMDRIRNLREKH